MALTPEKRRALMLARDRIEKGLDGYICFALGGIEVKHPRLKDACVELREFIGIALGSGRLSLNVCQRDRCILRTDDQIRADRIAWIDWMLGDEL